MRHVGFNSSVFRAVLLSVLGTLCSGSILLLVYTYAYTNRLDVYAGVLHWRFVSATYCVAALLANAPT